VTGIVSTGRAHAIIDRRTEQIGRLALALVTPLGSEDDDGGHLAPLSLAGAPVRVPGQEPLERRGARMRNSIWALATQR
jgi:hypothetical protein